SDTAAALCTRHAGVPVDAAGVAGFPRVVRRVAGAAVRRGVGAWRHLADCAAGAGVGRARSRLPAAARHLECELPVPPARQPALYHPAPRPRHQFVAAGGAVVGGELAQHAPLGSGLRPARRRPRPDRSVSRIDPRVRTPRVGQRRAVAYPRPARAPQAGVCDTRRTGARWQPCPHASRGTARKPPGIDEPAIARRWLMTSSVARITDSGPKTFPVMHTTSTDRTR